MYVKSTFVYILCVVKSFVNGAPDGVNGVDGPLPWFNRQAKYGDSPICPPNSQCVPSSTCQASSNSYHNGNPYDRNRYGYMNYCSYEASGFVCCPQSMGNVNRNYNNQRTCGLSLVENQGYVGIGTFPFVARIGFKDTDTGEMQYLCSGSIISERIILTAAHCALARANNFKIYTVRVGEFNTITQLDCGVEFCASPLQDISISHVIVHPGYQQKLFKDDIALLVLSAQINYTVTAQPVCLPETWSVIGNYATLVGWGELSGQTAEFTRQQAIQLPIVNIQQCINIYGHTLPISANHLCAGGERARDACSGFGGSPLLEKQGGSYYQVGVLSFGSKQCGAQGVPSVYTNIKNYVTWIRENIPIVLN